jgi:hypothetical protein
VFRAWCCMSPFQLLNSFNDFSRNLIWTLRSCKTLQRHAVTVFVRRFLKFVRLYACEQIKNCWMGLSWNVIWIIFWIIVQPFQSWLKTRQR